MRLLVEPIQYSLQKRVSGLLEDRSTLSIEPVAEDYTQGCSKHVHPKGLGEERHDHEDSNSEAEDCVLYGFW